MIFFLLLKNSYFDESLLAQVIRMNASFLYARLNSLGPSSVWLVRGAVFRLSHYYLDVGTSNQFCLKLNSIIFTGTATPVFSVFIKNSAIFQFILVTHLARLFPFFIAHYQICNLIHPIDSLHFIHSYKLQK